MLTFSVEQLVILTDFHSNLSNTDDNNDGSLAATTVCQFLDQQVQTRCSKSTC